MKRCFFTSLSAHRSSQRVRGVQPPHTPHYQTCAAVQRQFPGDGGERKNWMSKIKRLQTRERWDERKRIRGGGVLDEKLKRKEKEELFSKGLKTTRRIKPSRNSFALWGHRCTGFKTHFGGTDSSSVGCAWGETQNDAFWRHSSPDRRLIHTEKDTNTKYPNVFICIYTECATHKTAKLTL